MQNVTQYPADQHYTSEDWQANAQVTTKRAVLKGAIIANKNANDAFIRVRDTADGAGNADQGKRFWLVCLGTTNAGGPLSVAMSEIFARGIYFEAFTDYTATTPFGADLDYYVSYNRSA